MPSLATPQDPSEGTLWDIRQPSDSTCGNPKEKKESSAWSTLQTCLKEKLLSQSPQPESQINENDEWTINRFTALKFETFLFQSNTPQQAGCPTITDSNKNQQKEGI